MCADILKVTHNLIMYACAKTGFIYTYYKSFQNGRSNIEYLGEF